LTLEKVSIESDFPIYKYGNRSFLIDDTLKNNVILYDILNLLDNGFNFIPCTNYNFQSLIFNIIKNFDSKFYNFNANYFYSIKNNNYINSIDKNKGSGNIMEKLKSKRSIENIPILKDSLNFRFEFICNLHKHITNDKHKINLSYKEILSLKKFLKEKPFSIIEADKNVGACIISNELKDILTKNSLNDPKIYKKLETNPLFSSINYINSELKQLKDLKHISNSFYKKLVVKNSAKLSTYRINLKIHKAKFGIRPIVNCKNNATSKLSLFIEELLKPIVRNTESFLQDSQHLLQICDKIVLDDSEYYIYSCDFESLYTNIDLKLAMDLIIETLLENNISNQNFDIIAIKTILNLIFTQNYFSYKDEFFIQLDGIAMGIICGPSIANIVVAKLEKSWLFIHKPLIYRRYIDDIIIITKILLDEINFKNQFRNLKLNILRGKKLPFLDLIIMIDEIKRCIKFSLYVKPTNSFSFLKYNSNHPQHIFRNIPISCLIRIKRICSDYIDYLYYSRILLIQLLSRGYKFEYLNKAIKYIGKLDRQSLIQYKNKDQSDLFKNKIIISMKYDQNYSNIKKLLYSSWNKNDNKNNEIHTDINFNNKNKKSLFISSGVNTNLKRLLVFNAKLNRNLNYKSEPCNKLNCTICPFMETTNFFRFNNGLCFPILNNNNCDSKNCIYIIYCNRCINCFYIGETINFRTRFSTHKSSINNFDPIYKINTEVAEHFNLKDHEFTKNLKIIIFKSNIKDENIRKSIEDEIMFICDYTKTFIINTKRRNLSYINKFFTFDFI